MNQPVEVAEAVSPAFCFSPGSAGKLNPSAFCRLFCPCLCAPASPGHFFIPGDPRTGRPTAVNRGFFRGLATPRRQRDAVALFCQLCFPPPPPCRRRARQWAQQEHRLATGRTAGGGCGRGFDRGGTRPIQQGANGFAQLLRHVKGSMVLCYWHLRRAFFHPSLRSSTISATPR